MSEGVRRTQQEAEPGLRVYKLGGPALEDPRLMAPLAQELQRHATPAVVVHGGGLRVNRLLDRLGVTSRFVGGRRATSEEAMEIVEMVLSGTVNRELASALSHLGVPAVGLSGRDGRLIRARLEPGLGRVGVPEAVDPAPVRALIAAGFVPVVSPISDCPDGKPVNVNADEAALGIARALAAGSLVYLSDVDGVRVRDLPVERLDADAAEALIADGTIGGGMALKVRVALDAARAGIPEVVIAGRARLIDAFPGTRIVPPSKEEAR